MLEVRIKRSNSVDRTMGRVDPYKIILFAPVVKSIVSLGALIEISSEKGSGVPLNSLKVATKRHVPSRERSRRVGGVGMGGVQIRNAILRRDRIFVSKRSGGGGRGTRARTRVV